MSQSQVIVRTKSDPQPRRTIDSPQGAIPGWDLILSGVNVKTAVWSDAASIRKRLWDSPADSAWVSQTLRLGIGTNPPPYTFDVPPGFQAAAINKYIQEDFVGKDSDHYMSNITAQFGIEGAYGGFSGTLKAQFGMAEEMTQAYSFGTHTERWQLYSLKSPADLDYSSQLLNEQFRAELYGDKAMPVKDFYDKWGTHFTSDILIGGSASLSVYSLYSSTYDSQTFKADLTLAYASIAAKFQTTGDFSYDSESSKETYQSSTSLVLQGGDPTSVNPTAPNPMQNWLATVPTFPAFIDFNSEDGNGLTPMYMLIPDESDARRQALEQGLQDYLYPPLHLRVFAAASTAAEYPQVTVSVPDNYKILSGGAVASNYVAGELLTGSFPLSATQWFATAHDAGTEDTGILTAYAIAVYDPYDWLDVTLVARVIESDRDS